MSFTFDPNQLLAEPILAIDKLDAARRQLESAIELFFHDKDVVSQHTLVMAAHTILYDIAKKRGVGGSLREPTVGTPEERTHAINSFRLPQNFFKHADQDPQGRLRFSPSITQFVIFDAGRLFVLLAGEPTRSMKVFLMWFQLRYPDLFTFEPIEPDLQHIRASTTDPAVLKSIAKDLL